MNAPRPDPVAVLTSQGRVRERQRLARRLERQKLRRRDAAAALARIDADIRTTARLLRDLADDVVQYYVHAVWRMMPEMRVYEMLSVHNVPADLFALIPAAEWRHEATVGKTLYYDTPYGQDTGRLCFHLVGDE